MNEFDILGRGGSFLFWRKGLVSTLIETLLEYTCGGISPRDKLFYVCYESTCRYGLSGSAHGSRRGLGT